MTVDLIRNIRSLAAALVVCLLPTSAWSVDLFEGNIGYEGDWLYVDGSSAMGDRIYWYDLGGDVTYHFELATDENFSNVVLNLGGILENYVEPDMGPGFYFFRVSAFDAFGAFISGSKVGTLEVAADNEPPHAAILSCTTSDTLQIELAVSDDTVLHLARFTVGGTYAGVLGLKTQDYKLMPSFGESRIVTFDGAMPNGSGGLVEISVAVSDVMYNTVTTAVAIDCGGDGTATETGGTSTSTKGRGKGKGKKK